MTQYKDEFLFKTDLPCRMQPSAHRLLCFLLYT